MRRSTLASPAGVCMPESGLHLNASRHCINKGGISRFPWRHTNPIFPIRLFAAGTPLGTPDWRADSATLWIRTSDRTNSRGDFRSSGSSGQCAADRSEGARHVAVVDTRVQIGAIAALAGESIFNNRKLRSTGIRTPLACIKQQIQSSPNSSLLAAVVTNYDVVKEAALDRGRTGVNPTD